MNLLAAEPPGLGDQPVKQLPPMPAPPGPRQRREVVHVSGERSSRITRAS